MTLVSFTEELHLAGVCQLKIFIHQLETQQIVNVRVNAMMRLCILLQVGCSKILNQIRWCETQMFGGTQRKI